MRLTELKPLVIDAMTKQAIIVSNYKGCENPQEIAAMNEAKGRLAAYEAVWEALKAPRTSAAFALMADAGRYRLQEKESKL